MWAKTEKLALKIWKCLKRCNLTIKKWAPGKLPRGLCWSITVSSVRSRGSFFFFSERQRDLHLWWVMKVILSKWWNYIQQSPRGSISYCSVTGKINWDLLIHRERPSPILSCAQRKGLRVISFPSTPTPTPPPFPNTNVRSFQVCYRDVKHK